MKPTTARVRVDLEVDRMKPTPQLARLIAYPVPALRLVTLATVKTDHPVNFECAMTAAEARGVADELLRAAIEIEHACRPAPTRDVIDGLDCYGSIGD